MNELVSSNRFLLYVLRVGVDVIQLVVDVNVDLRPVFVDDGVEPVGGVTNSSCFAPDFFSFGYPDNELESARCV